MTKILFFNIADEIEKAAFQVFKSLGVTNILEGDSTNLLNGIYFWHSIFGARIKLEYNSYGYDDKYRYMLSIKQDVLSELDVDDEIVDLVSRIIIALLLNNLKIEIGLETGDETLTLFTPIQNKGSM